LDIEKAVTEMDSVGQEKMDGDKESWVCGELGVGDGDGSEMEGVEKGGEYEGVGYGKRLLKPRSQRFLDEGVLDGMRMWHRPPHNHCDRCAKHDEACARLLELTTALLSSAADPEHATRAAVVERAGGSVAAWAEQRSLALKLPDLLKHVQWQAETRPYLKKREKAMVTGEAL
jgi:hypothetical protein